MQKEYATGDVRLMRRQDLFPTNAHVRLKLNEGGDCEKQGGLAHILSTPTRIQASSLRRKHLPTQ